ncbi:MAG: nucleotidyltransferase family protein [Anaerolineae bacterium]|nr:nucleotidyltransferase family protein [Anaerolineae bacterium]
MPPTIPTPQRDGVCWPTAQQESLLHAALDAGQDALSAWRAWSASVAIETLDPGSQGILSLAYANLRRLEANDALLTKCKGLYRLTWYENQRRKHTLGQIATALQDAGVPVLVLKGMALIVHYYRDYGRRPMHDVDLLTPTEDAPRVLALLGARGWAPPARIPDPLPRPVYDMRHSLGLTGAAGASLDLHWHVLRQCCAPGDDAAFWEAAVPLNLNGIPARSLCPADQVLHICVHGIAWNPVPSFRWIADAVTVLRATGETFDWPRLVAQTRQRRLAPWVLSALEYLNRAFDVTVPGDVLETLHAIPLSRADLLEFDAYTRPPTLLRDLTRYWFLYRRMTPAPRPPWGFPRFLKYSWFLRRTSQMPPYVARHVAKRVRAHLERRSSRAK